MEIRKLYENVKLEDRYDAVKLTTMQGTPLL